MGKNLVVIAVGKMAGMRQVWFLGLASPVPHLPPKQSVLRGPQSLWSAKVAHRNCQLASKYIQVILPNKTVLFGAPMLGKKNREFNCSCHNGSIIYNNVGY